MVRSDLSEGLRLCAEFLDHARAELPPDSFVVDEDLMRFIRHCVYAGKFDFRIRERMPDIHSVIELTKWFACDVPKPFRMHFSPTDKSQKARLVFTDEKFAPTSLEEMQMMLDAGRRAIDPLAMAQAWGLFQI